MSQLKRSYKCHACKGTKTLGQYRTYRPCIVCGYGAGNPVSTGKINAKTDITLINYTMRGKSLSSNKKPTGIKMSLSTYQKTLASLNARGIMNKDGVKYTLNPSVRRYYMSQL